jgi:hypothetical protein
MPADTMTRPITSDYPIVILNGELCVPRHLLTEQQQLQIKTVGMDPEKFVKDYEERCRYLRALRVMESAKELDLITLISCDGFEFLISRDVACQSPHIAIHLYGE